MCIDIKDEARVLNGIKPVGLCATAGTPTPDFALAREHKYIPQCKQVLNIQHHSGRVGMRSACCQAHKFVDRDVINLHPGSCLDSTQEMEPEPVTTGMPMPSLNRLCQPVGTLNATRLISSSKRRCLLDDIGHQVAVELLVVVCSMMLHVVSTILDIVCFDRSFGFGM